MVFTGIIFDSPKSNLRIEYHATFRYGEGATGKGHDGIHHTGGKPGGSVARATG